MKKTRTIHRIYEEWLKLPKEIRNIRYFNGRCIIGKWHYHYKNENGEIGLVRFNHSLNFAEPGFHYEACGTLDFERFTTISKAESAIYEKLGEALPEKGDEESSKNSYKKRSNNSSSYKITN